MQSAVLNFSVIFLVILFPYLRSEPPPPNGLFYSEFQNKIMCVFLLSSMYAKWEIHRS
jgi:hypothetical protein